MPDLALTDSPVTDPLTIYRWRDGMYAADLLTAAIVHLDLFTWLAEQPSTLEGICAHFGIRARPADVMLTLLTAMGLVISDRGVFRPTPVAREHLVSGSPWFVGPYYATLKERPVCLGFVDVLHTDRVANWAGLTDHRDWHESMNDPEFASRFTAAMDCRGRYLGQALARSLDLGDHSRMLDVAGGSGIYACALVAANPHLHATVLELPPVDGAAATAITERGLDDRIDVVGLDMLVDPWPSDADVHLFSNVLHDWPETTMVELLTCSFDALPVGGSVIIHDAFIDRDKRGPLPVAQYSALLMHSTKGKCHSIGEYEACLTRAGFVDFDYAPTVADRGRMVARKPAKHR